MAQPSTRFSLSVHILTVLAQHRGETLSSTQIAQCVGTNPAFVRRILADLARAGLTRGRLGKGGGASLARGPKRISLLDIYRAVECAAIVSIRKTESSGKPLDGAALAARVEPVLRGAVAEAEAAFFAALNDVSLRQVVKAAA